MNNKPYLLAETTWKQVRDTRYSVAILPWGATEAHNYHLPYATDNYESDAVAASAAEKAWNRGARVVVLPAVPFGVNSSQRDIALCINMNPSTQAIVLRDIVESIELSGIDKLVILNGHGGNDFKQMIRELQPRTKVFLSTINWYAIVDPTQYFEDSGDHAGELETSVCMHIIPGLVAPLREAGSGKENASRIQGFREKWAWSPRQWTKVTADTGIGNPVKASPEKGKKYFEAVSEKIAGFLCELAAADIDNLYETDTK